MKLFHFMPVHCRSDGAASLPACLSPTAPLPSQEAVAAYSQCLFCLSSTWRYSGDGSTDSAASPAMTSHREAGGTLHKGAPGEQGVKMFE